MLSSRQQEAVEVADVNAKTMLQASCKEAVGVVGSQRQLSELQARDTQLEEVKPQAELHHLAVAVWAPWGKVAARLHLEVVEEEDTGEAPVAGSHPLVATLWAALEEVAT